MIKNFNFLVLAATLVSILGSCTKDPAGSANPGGNAVYTMAGTPSTCTSPAVAGLYSAGLQLAGSNTITVSVNVVAKGSYALYTNNSNGVYFIGNGVFTTTGPQSVVLIGKGTPKAAGNFTFVLATVNTCSFSVTFNSGVAAASFTYAGAPGNCTAPIISGTYAVGAALGASNYVDLTVNVSNPGTYTVSTSSFNGISFSASGAFGSTGTQVLRLQGSGTPATATSSSFTPSGGGCSFSIAVVPPLPAATFTYDMRGGPSSANCSSLTWSGTFEAGTPLDASNYMEVGVIVNTTGTYNVSTNSNNGVTFNASGVFTSTGAQMMTFTSTDTPVDGGVFTYIPSGGCAFTIDYDGVVGGNANFYTCKIDNVVSNFNESVIGSLNSTPSPPYDFSIDGFLTGGSDRLRMHTNDMNLVVAGNTYNNYTLANNVKYCYAEYQAAGTTYSTSTANPNSFSLTITSITATHVFGTFSGTLYENGTGPATKTITAGSFKDNH